MSENATEVKPETDAAGVPAEIPVAGPSTSSYPTNGKMVARVDLVNLYDMLGTVKTNVTAVQWRWRAAAMRRQIADVVEPIVEQRDAVQKARPKELDDKRIKLCQDYAKQTEAGNPMMSDNNFVIDPARKKEFDAAFSDLLAEFKPQRDAFDKLVNETNDWLREEIPMPLITGALFPLVAFNEATPQELLEVLFDHIDPSDAKDEKSVKKKKKDDDE
jgi:hypothetical protein